jgi:hypothetical protein
MDRVRFGRALGVGARQAAKTLMSAAEAAAAPDPRRRPPQPGVVETPNPAARQASSPRPAVNPEVIGTQARMLKKSFWGPFAKFSSVLWLEVSGTFFAIFALIAGLQIWRFRGALLLSPSVPDARRLYVYVVIFVLFGYFTVSNFVRASRRQRR